MLTEQDVIVVHVAGSNGRSAASTVVARRFNGFGAEIDDQGRVTGGRGLNIPEGLRGGRQGGAGEVLPEFDVNKYLELNRKRDLDGIKALQLDFARRIAASQANGIGDPKAAIAKAVIEYCKNEYGATENDHGARADQLVIKPENVDVTVFRAPNNGPMTYTVTGTAVYGE